MGPGDLAAALRGLDVPVDGNVLVGLHTGDDAGVYRLSDELVLIQTVDFIAPVVDDPFRFGQIAAANSLSDVYAMGGVPVTAMNVVCYPQCELGPEVLAEVLAGGASKIREAGASLVGGHTVDGPELLYGLSVTGTARPGAIVTNAGARPGDRLVLTEPLGLGLLATAVKAGMAAPGDAEGMAVVMARLNRAASRWLAEFGARACTDVTGFGLAGHALGMARESGVDLVLSWAAVPVLPGAREAALQGLIPGGAYRNRDAYAGRLEARAADPDAVLIACDPQTSGGLLVALPAAAAEAYARAVRDEGAVHAAVIGEVEEGRGVVVLT